MSRVEYLCYERPDTGFMRDGQGNWRAALELRIPRLDGKGESGVRMFRGAIG